MDALIVGAGPAGSLAALVLARAGARVRLVDRAAFPRPKLCGDTLNPGALALLDRLDAAAGVRARALPIDGMIVSGPDGTQVVGEYGDGVRGAALTREMLDTLLLDAAVRAGARFEAGVDVRAPLTTGDGSRVVGVRAVTGGVSRELRAPVVVAADGSRSRLASRLGLTRRSRCRRWAFGAYYADVDGLTRFGEMHIRGGGYIGIAPLPGGLANVCVVRDLVAARPKPSGEVDGIVDRAVAGDAALRERFRRARRVGPVASLGPLAVETAGPGMYGLLLAGDAAGFIDPMTGDGLRLALRGAELAAHAALAELATGQPAHRALAAARRREFGGKWLVNRTLRALVGSPAAVRAAAALASRWDAPVRALIAMAGDVREAARG